MQIFVHEKDDSQSLSMNQFVVPVDINGHSTALIVDTGDQTTGISPSFQTALEVDPLLRSFSPQEEFFNGHRISRINLRDLNIGGVHYHNVQGDLAVASSINVQAGASSGFSVAGMLGTDFLRKHQAIVDCGKDNLLLLNNPRAEPITPALVTQGWVAVPLKISDSGHLVVAGNINGCRGTFIVDTGAAHVLLNQSQVKRTKIALTGRHLKINGVLTKDADAGVAWVNALALGNCPPGKCYAAVSGKWEEMVKMTGANLGIIGLEFLREYSAVIDYRTKTLYLKPPQATNQTTSLRAGGSATSGPS